MTTEPIEEQYRESMQRVAAALDEIFNPGQRAPNKAVGFVLLLFPYGSHDGRCNYISNGADRRDITVLFREMISRFEGAPEQTGKA
jgi:hypothetical protein